MTKRVLSAIGADIRAAWHPMPDAADMYLRCMQSLRSITDQCGEATGTEIVRFFLANATQWQGATAELLKGELHAMLPRASHGIGLHATAWRL